MFKLDVNEGAATAVNGSSGEVPRRAAPAPPMTAYVPPDDSYARACAGVTFAIFMLPLIITEFFFGLHNTSCQHHVFFITLSTWLVVDASYQLFVLFVCLVSLALPRPVMRDTDVDLVRVCCAEAAKFVGFGCTATWTIVGAALFWGDLLPTGECARDVSILMWIRLIGGFIGLIKQLVNKT
jgi:hypothetical protein